MVGKADTLTPEELGTFKKQIMNQIRQSNIKIYEFPQEKEINAKLPFAVVGSNCVLDINGEKIRGRRYPWGVVNVSIKLGSTPNRRSGQSNRLLDKGIRIRSIRSGTFI